MQCKFRILARNSSTRVQLEEQLTVGGLNMSSGPCSHLLFVDDYICTRTQRRHEFAMRGNHPYILSRLKGAELWVGPEVIPGRTPCWLCLLWWLQLREIDTSCDAGTEDSRKFLASILKKFTDGALSLEGRICSLTAGKSNSEWHEVLRRPNCPDCGSGMVAGAIAPLERIRRSVSPITGFVTHIETRESYRSVISFARIVTPHAPSVPRQRAAGSIAVAGQGEDRIAAERACMAEAAERYSAVFQGHEPRVHATYEQIGEAAIAPGDLLQFSGLQYENRHAWNHGEWGFPYVPPPCHPLQPMEWTAVSSLTEQGERFLPTQMCYSASAPAGTPLYCVPDSNGCAAGPSLQDAVARGFLELVERDAIAIWWYNRIRRSSADPDYLDDPDVASICKELRKQRQVEILDLTTDLGIFVFGAISWDATGGDITLGFGAHFNPTLAARRAAFELAQVTCEQEDLSSKTLPRGSLEHAFGRWRRQARISSEAYLTPISAKHSAKPESYVDSGRSLFEQCLAICRRKGFNLLALNLTRPEIGLPVARVICPQLRSPWRRLAPGRLYQVPVELGWLPRPYTEDELNPSPYCL